MDYIIRWLKDDIAKLKEDATAFARRADGFQEEANAVEFAPDVQKQMIHWRNHYQIREGYCKIELFKKQLEIRRLTA